MKPSPNTIALLDFEALIVMLHGNVESYSLVKLTAVLNGDAQVRSEVSHTGTLGRQARDFSAGGYPYCPRTVLEAL